MMRKLLMSLTVVAGATIAAISGAQAAPHGPAVQANPLVEQVQYYPGYGGGYRGPEYRGYRGHGYQGYDWRRARWDRHQGWERHRRHEEWRRWHQPRRW